jgi:hypothetical protein
MAHPADGRIVPACAQHAVFDPQENRRLVELLRGPRAREDQAPTSNRDVGERLP